MLFLARASFQSRCCWIRFSSAGLKIFWFSWNFFSSFFFLCNKLQRSGTKYVSSSYETLTRGTHTSQRHSARHARTHAHTQPHTLWPHRTTDSTRTHARAHSHTHTHTHRTTHRTTPHHTTFTTRAGACTHTHTHTHTARARGRPHDACTDTNTYDVVGHSK